MKQLRSVVDWLVRAPIPLILFAVSPPALAYIGPGSGLTVIGTALALVGGIVLLTVGDRK